MMISLTPIARLVSPYREKFGIPRQPGLSPVTAQVVLLPPFNQPASVEGLTGFSHIWLIFAFHAVEPRPGKHLSVRPPRLGGNERVGVFASRATHRPNGLGLSLVELLSLETQQGVRLQVRGADLLHDTPIFDIKPYLPQFEAIPQARAGFASTPPKALPVIFLPKATACGINLYGEQWENMAEWIRSCLQYNPRPAYHNDAQRVYGWRFADLNIKWCTDGTQVWITQIEHSLA